MDFEWTKGHWLVIFSETPLWLVLLISLAVTLPVGMGRISFLLALLFVPLLRTARFIRARIGVDNGTLLLRAGWLFRKEERISAAFVTGVELNQSLLLRPWGIWQVRISFLGAAFRPVFALPRDQADTLLCLLLGKKGSRGSACKASKREFIRWGLFQPRTVKITALLTPFLAAISALLRLLSRQTLAPQDYEAALRVIFYLALLGGVLLGLYLLGSLVSLLYKLIIYYRFRVTSYDRLLHVAHGLLRKREFWFSRNWIIGMRLTQSALMRPFGYYTVRLTARGYGGFRRTPLLFPMARRETLETLLQAALLQPLPRLLLQPPARSRRYFLWRWPIWISGGATLICAALDLRVFGGLAFFLFLAAFADGALRRRNAAAGASQGLILIAGGGLLQSIELFRRSAAGEASVLAPVWKLRQGLCSLAIRLPGNFLRKSVAAPNLDAAKTHILQRFLLR